MGNLGATAYDLWDILSRGGWVMGAIFLAGQAGWFLVAERWWHYRKMGGRRGLTPKVEASVSASRGGGREAMVESARQTLGEFVPGLSRGLDTIAVLAMAAPLLGLAGTVAGIMETFHVITLYGAGNPSMLAGGIAQALMVTEAGLVVAFPLLLCHDHLRKRAEAIEDDCIAKVTPMIRTLAGSPA